MPNIPKISPKIYLSSSFLLFRVSPGIVNIFYGRLLGEDIMLFSSWIGDAISDLTDAVIYVFLTAPVKNLLIDRTVRRFRRRRTSTLGEHLPRCNTIFTIGRSSGS